MATRCRHKPCPIVTVGSAEGSVHKPQATNPRVPDNIHDCEEELIYEKLPKDIAERHVLLLDPILATGNSAARAIQARPQRRQPCLAACSALCLLSHQRLHTSWPVSVSRAELPGLHLQQPRQSPPAGQGRDVAQAACPRRCCWSGGCRSAGSCFSA